MSGAGGGCGSGDPAGGVSTGSFGLGAGGACVTTEGTVGVGFAEPPDAGGAGDPPVPDCGFAVGDAAVGPAGVDEEVGADRALPVDWERGAGAAFAFPPATADRPLRAPGPDAAAGRPAWA